MPACSSPTPRTAPRGAHLHLADDGSGAPLVLGHGAGGGVGAPDLVLATEVAQLEAGRDGRAGSSSPTASPGRPVDPGGAPARRRLDPRARSSSAVGPLAGLPVPWTVGGCRVRASRAGPPRRSAPWASWCLAFPARRAPSGKSRQRAELDGVAVPVLVVPGGARPLRDPRARPGCARSRSSHGDHGLKSDRAGLRSAVGAWLAALQPFQSSASIA